MIRFSAGSALALTLALVASPTFASTSHHAHKSIHKSGTMRRVGHRLRHPIGQRGIAPERATEIQSALIKANYLTGTPSGKWDAETEAAMQKYQADHGWQTKLTPDSRALIALGLGPSTATSQPLPANTYSAATPEPAEAGTLASVHSIAQ
jgi:peptidoglycan hydrolase-like protein with peptidoglycan-binding domain